LLPIATSRSTPTARCWDGSRRARCPIGRCTAGSSSTPSTSTPNAAGGGVGRALLAALIESTEAAGIWTIQSGIFPENTASLALHARVGFRVVGLRERLGLHDGRWRDVILLERRSTSVGVAG
jgi:GNAT superfamily N-acetyltransferase